MCISGVYVQNKRCTTVVSQLTLSHTVDGGDGEAVPHGGVSQKETRYCMTIDVWPGDAEPRAHRTCATLHPALSICLSGYQADTMSLPTRELDSQISGDSRRCPPRRATTRHSTPQWGGVCNGRLHNPNPIISISNPNPNPDYEYAAKLPSI